MKKFLKVLVWIIIILFIGWCIFALIVRPSNNRDWVVDNEKLAHFEMNGDMMKIYNVRNFTYKSTLDFTPGYYDETYDLSKLYAVDFVVAPFNPPTAHTYVVFGFEDGKRVAISIEARREKGESYNVFKGMFRQFEMIYVVADERDVTKLRTNYREDGNVYMYPIKISKTKARDLFMDMMNKTNSLYNKPQFYNTITNNCTNTLVKHVNRIADKDSQIGFSYKYVLPAYSDKLAYDHGLIDDVGEFEVLKEKYRITDIGKSCENAQNFSMCIRADL